MCDAMDPSEVDKTKVDQILNSIVDGMRADRPNEMKLAAITAMCNSLAFTDDHFEVQVERDVIINAVCSVTQCADVHAREKAFECLATIADLHYSKLPPYITTIFNLSMTAIRTDAQEVGQQAIEFWSTVCDTESDYAQDMREGILEQGVQYFRIIEQAANMLVPTLLETLSKQSEDEDDSWNIARAGAACLEAIAQTISDSIVPLVLPFVTSNINSSNWRLKEAAIMAFGMILDGPSAQAMGPVVSNALPVLVNCMQDKSTIVKDTCAWVLGRICEFHTGSVSAEVLPQMVAALLAALEDESASVASQACYAIHNMAQACEDESEAPSNVLSQFMPRALDLLLRVVNREDWEVNNLRSVAYEAVNMMVQNSAMDMLSMVNLVLVEAMNRLEKTFNDSMDQQERMNLQSQLCSLIGVCVQKLPEENVKPHSDRIMQLVLHVFKTKGAVAHEDAFLTIGYMCSKLEEEFCLRYADHIIPPVIQGLKTMEEHAVCTVAIGVAGDLCRGLKKQIFRYTDEIMRCTLEILQSQTINRYETVVV